MHAAKTISQRGVQMVATAHGTDIHSLMKNAELVPLLGGLEVRLDYVVCTRNVTHWGDVLCWDRAVLGHSMIRKVRSPDAGAVLFVPLSPQNSV